MQRFQGDRVRVKVDENHSLERDTETGAIVNNDSSGYQSYIARRKAMREKDTQINNLENEVQSLKDELEDIKNIMSDLVAVLRERGS